jgi:hypothetical protein
LKPPGSFRLSGVNCGRGQQTKHVLSFQEGNVSVFFPFLE